MRAKQWWWVSLAMLAACGGETKTAKKDVVTGTDTVADAATDAAGADAGADTVTAGNAAAQQAILGVPQTQTWVLPGLSGEVQVVRTQGNVAHVYGKNRKDVAQVMGFVMASDRYFQMELTRRMGLGTLSALLGDAALETDADSRAKGSAHVADGIVARLNDEQKDLFDGYAAGVNAYIDAVIDGKLPEPSEIAIAKGLLGGTAKTLMLHWDRRSVAGASAAIVYNLGYETDDVGRTQNIANIATQFEGKALGELRKKGAIADIELNVDAVKPVSSAAGLGLDLGGKAVTKTEPGKVPTAGKFVFPQGLPAEMLLRLQGRFAAQQRRSGHDKTNGFGSNSWAVAGAGSAGGAGIVAGDGHLPLSVPSLFYQMGLDTRVFGGGPLHQKGLMIPGLPLLAVGTNGAVGWSQTQLGGDITDWYREELTLDANGLPASTLFQGEQKPVVKVEEVYVVANVPILGSKGRTETWPRWKTWDGRFIADIEGPTVKQDAALQAGQSLINLGGRFVIPKDTNGDGKVTAVTFDFTGLDSPDIIGAVDGFGHAKDVYELRDATRHLVAYSQNIVAADSQGNAFYTGYQAVPCRGYLPRNPDGTFQAGADPKQLIDGTKYRGFTVPLLADGRVDEGKGKDDPYSCVVPFDEYPQSINPPSGYVLTANNDPGNLTSDGSLTNDKWYIGGPWANGYRADTIDQGLKAVVATKAADAEAMAKLQASNRSRLGEDWVPFLLQAIEAGKQASGKAQKSPDEQRLADLYDAITPTVSAEVVTRLGAWHKAGTPALSGIETFYHQVAAGEKDHAIATMIFNAWMGRFVSRVFDDENINLWEPWGADARTRALTDFRDGRGANNPKNLASWNPTTQESAFFDVLGSDAIETSHECALFALKQGLDFLYAKPDSDGFGGFGTADMTQWIWGLRHGVHFDSILGEFLGSDPTYAPLTAAFNITPEILPLAPKYEKGDPRNGLPFFPRGGDAFAVDAAGGMGKSAFDYGSGPVFRMVIVMGKDKTTGLNVLPGGQSGLTDSKHFADQAQAWLANQAWPLRFEVADVVAGAIGREVYRPQ